MNMCWYAIYSFENSNWEQQLLEGDLETQIMYVPKYLSVRQPILNNSSHSGAKWQIS